MLFCYKEDKREDCKLVPFFARDNRGECQAKARGLGRASARNRLVNTRRPQTALVRLFARLSQRKEGSNITAETDKQTTPALQIIIEMGLRRQSGAKQNNRTPIYACAPCSVSSTVRSNRNINRANRHALNAMAKKLTVPSLSKTYRKNINKTRESKL